MTIKKGLSPSNRIAMAREIWYLRTGYKAMCPMLSPKDRNHLVRQDAICMLQSGKNWLYGKILPF